MSATPWRSAVQGLLAGSVLLLACGVWLVIESQNQTRECYASVFFTGDSGACQKIPVTQQFAWLAIGLAVAALAGALTMAALSRDARRGVDES